MDSNARITGYLTLLVLLLLSAVAGGLFRGATYQSHRLVRLHLPETGSLISDDPVTEKGVMIGRVRSIEQDPVDQRALVEIELDHRGFIPADSRFVDFNQSPLGSRSILLVPGRSDAPLDATRIQEGYFVPSAVEVLHRVGELVQLTETLRSDLERLFLNDQAPLSPQQLNLKMTGSLLRLQRMIQATEPLETQVKTGAEAWIQAGTLVRRNIRSAQSRVGGIWDQTDAFLNVADSAEDKIALDLTQAQNLLSQLQDSAGVADWMLRDRSLYDNLESTLHFLRDAIQGMKQNGLNKKIQFRRNIHFVFHHSP